MDASAATRRTIFAHDTLGPLSALARTMSAALMALLAVAAAIIWLRRGAGSLVVPLPAASLVAAGSVICLSTALFRRTCGPPPPMIRRSWSAITALAVPTVVCVLAAAALSLGGSSSLGLLGLWALVIGEEAIVWGAALGRLPRRAAVRPVKAISHRVALRSGSDMFDEIISNPLDDESAWQYYVRRRDDAGSEVIEGWVRLEFAAQQRHATAHLAICPPLERTPECYAELGDGPEGEVKVGQLLPWGVRLDVKLDQPADEPTTALVEFSIQDRAASDTSDN